MGDRGYCIHNMDTEEEVMLKKYRGESIQLLN